MDLLKVKMLKPVGPYQPGQIVELSPEVAAQVADGKKAMLLQDFVESEVLRKDVSNLTVKEMNDMNMKNVTPVDEHQEIRAKMDAAAQAGKPVATGEPLVPTGGVTPPPSVFPAMAEAQKIETTPVEDVKPKKADVKPEPKPEPKKADKK